MSDIAEHICTYVAARERLQAELAAAKAELSKKFEELAAAKAELAAAIKQRDDAQRWLRDACAEIARIENRFYYDALTPQQIAERNGWNCFGKKEGGGA